MSSLDWNPELSLRDIKIRAIKQALFYHGGNITRTAKALRIALRTLRNAIYQEPELADFRRPPNGAR